jgi:fructosamine-3-kinase
MSKSARHNWSHYYASKRIKVGLSPTYERGHKHAAEEIADEKRQERVSTRRKENDQLRKGLWE